MEYTFSTTKEMDAALAYEATKQGKTAEELFNIIITADMGTLLRNHESVAKTEIAEIYAKLEPVDKEVVDVIFAKVASVKPVDTKPPVEKEVIPK